MQFSKRLAKFGPEIFAALNDKKAMLEAEGRSIYNLSVGTPDFAPPAHIRQALIDAASDPANWRYSLRDEPALLAAVCGYYQDRFGVALTPDMVMSVYGSQEGIGHIGLALCDEGDTVLLPDPGYPVFTAGSLLGRAEPFYYPLSPENDFLPGLAAIPSEVAQKAKYIIVSLPANPVGSVAAPSFYEGLVAWARQYDVLVIHDNAYSDIIFDGRTGGSFLGTPGAKEVGVEFFSLSKSFNVTGARLSFLIGRPDVIAAVRLLRSQIDFGMFLPLQQAAIAALTGPRESVKAQCAEYQTRRDALCGGLREIGWPVQNSRGSMFVWAKLPGTHTDSMAFCLQLLEKAGVVCTPGISFGARGEGYVRFALVLPPDRIKEAVEAIRRSGLVG